MRLLEEVRAKRSLQPLLLEPVKGVGYRVTSLIRNSARLGTCSRTMTEALCQSLVGGQFLMSDSCIYISSYESDCSRNIAQNVPSSPSCLNLWRVSAFYISNPD